MMGTRFRKSFKIAPGIKINLSKSGISTSLGVKGATLNISSKGIRSTVGLPGTGLSHQEYYRYSPSAKEHMPRSLLGSDPEFETALLIILGITACFSVSLAYVVYGPLGASIFIAGLFLVGWLFFKNRRAEKERWARIEWETSELEKQAYQKKVDDLKNKYNDEHICSLILAGEIWEGQTSEQLRDSLGAPQDIDEKVLKTKRKEIWKYDWQGANRYNLRITLENDAVIGWERK